MYVISVPISVPNPTKGNPNRRWYLNLNQYRNTHFQTLYKAKETFSRIVKPLLGSLPRMEKVNLIYDLYVGNHQLCDTSNICSIVDKFFSDVLVNTGTIEDDNYTVVLSAVYRYGGLDKGNGHVKVTIQPVGPAGLQKGETTDQEQQTEEEKPMQITIRQAEIEAAIRQYVAGQVQVQEGRRIDIQLSAKRGPGGFQAVVDIVAADAPAGTSGQTSEGTADVSTGSAAAATTEAKPARAAKASSLFGDAASAPTNEASAPVAEPA